MKTIESIQFKDWQDSLQTFTSGNAGRIAAIAAEGITLVENKPFTNVDYDPVGRGSDLTISLEGHMHTVSAPVELKLEKQDNGVVSTLEVVDQNNDSTYLRLI